MDHNLVLFSLKEPFWNWQSMDRFNNLVSLIQDNPADWLINTYGA
jgi:hypothetical protein